MTFDEDKIFGDDGCSQPRAFPVTHVLFDLDGVIIESESIYEKISADICREYGKTYTKDLKSKVMGTPEFETCRIIVTDLNLPLTPAEFLKKYEDKVWIELQRPELLPGVKDVVKLFHKHDVPIAIATSSREPIMKMKTKPHRELINLFRHVVCGSSDPEVKNNKPAPDIFLVCASRFPDKPHPSQCLVFEDSPNGVQAALNAGMQVVMVPNPDLHPDHPIRSKATQVLESFEHFEPEMFGLPSRV
ncbi:pseudouridine-5'-phosphatase [Diabrotica virgifera virgifera]|uniref:pseudouridine 5'-phosphatase n=1 Tax=Diabrotica virgifera virgifera TaxID=50390 RepID=A0A6P7GCX1_DIAVI|nr:pseudouridine-5'-phosphatase [Diabrotica virgifera virgifera]XP_050507068.1 pseudouridine-5'-phosphatase [Diabrotica virgifera virgifera]XP_050507069.1 pseudouridine-5'-phosphatase [Diabrotica virgifera virgifera]XP_050507070.1 pseudouridine-5'-phosphatase [Diabrotica virgifera virgifera]